MIEIRSFEASAVTSETASSQMPSDVNEARNSTSESLARQEYFCLL